MFQLRTRTSLLTTLCDALKEKTREFLGSEGGEGSGDTPKSEIGPGTRFIDTVRKALARVRIPNAETNNNNTAKRTPTDIPTPLVSSWIMNKHSAKTNHSNTIINVLHVF